MTSPEPWPVSGLDCLVCAEFAPGGEGGSRQAGARMSGRPLLGMPSPTVSRLMVEGLGWKLVIFEKDVMVIKKDRGFSVLGFQAFEL